MALLFRGPLWVLGILVSVVVLTDLGAMWLLERVWGLSGLVAALVNAGILTVTALPVTYLLVVRPSREQVAALEREVARRGIAEQRLARENALNKMLIDSLPHPAWLVTGERRVLLQNRSGAELGSKEGEHCWQGIHRISLGEPRTGPCSHCLADEALADNKTKRMEIQEGGRIWDAYWVPVDCGGGIYLHYLLDVTQHKREQEENRKAREAAESASRAKGEFLSTMSHEIRTPMNGVMGMLELVCETELTAEQHEYLGLARRSATSLMRVINDILDFSKLEAGKMQFEANLFHLRTLVEEVVASLSYQAREKGLELKTRWQPDVPEQAVGDAGRLRQVLVNLVGNALKFTEAGEIVIGICRDAAAPPDSSTVPIRFCVADTGIGIREDQFSRLFSRFSQLEETMTRHYSGTGLGLAISKQIVERLGGRIWVESQEGKGSTFSFTLPLKCETAAPAPSSGDGILEVPVSSEESVSLNVLLAEDNSVNQKLVRLLLEKRGHRVTTVEDGSAALNALAAEAFDLVLMDVQMPEMDGLDATRALRASEGSRRRTPVIGLTALATAEDRDACLSAGMDDFVSKPLRASSLFETIDRVMRLGVDPAGAREPRRGT